MAEDLAGEIRVLTPKDIQKMFKLGKNSAYDLMHSPSFPSFTINNRLFVTEESLREWVKTYIGRTYFIGNK